MKIKKGKLSIILISISICISISSCNVKDVKSNNQQHINIYSDFFSSKDHKIFRAFERENNIKVHIHHFKSKQVIKKILDEGYNCNADVILFKSIFHTNKLLSKNKFQAFQSKEIEENIHSDFRSDDNSWVAFGINPYLFTSNSNKIFENQNLNVLLKLKRNKNLSFSNMIPLFSQFKKTEFNLSKSEDYLANRLLINNQEDSTQSNLELKTYTNYIKDNNKQAVQFFPSHETCYYNLYTISILKQAKNFNNALIFTEYLTNPLFNEKINEYIGSIPMDITRLKNSYKYYKEPLILFPIPYKKSLTEFSYYEQLFKKNILE